MVRNIKLIKNIFILKTICFNQNYNKITFKTFFNKSPSYISPSANKLSVNVSIANGIKKYCTVGFFGKFQQKADAEYCN